MKVTRQRNPYLKRISANTPHKYSYDIETGKYMLHVQNKPDLQINKTGTLKNKFKHYFSGFSNHKQRYQEALKQPAFMHYVPDARYNKSKSYYTPMPDKFAGYTQYPYKMTKQFPEHLGKSGEFPASIAMMRKCQSEAKKEVKAKSKKSTSVILEHSATTFMNQQEKDKYFNLSFMSMTESKPLPKKQKKTCYNYKCKHMKYFIFDQKQKAQESTKYGTNSFSNTFGLSFHRSTLRMEDQESKLISQMG